MLDGQRAAVVLLSAIGDVVHALPLVASLKAAAPDLAIEWVTQPVPGEIAGRHPAVDRLWTLDRGRGWRAYRDLSRNLRGRRFDLVIDLQVYAKASLVTALLDSPRKIGFDRRRARELTWLVTNERIPAGPLRQTSEQYLEFADYLGVRAATVGAAARRSELTAQAEFYACLPRARGAVVAHSRSCKRAVRPLVALADSRPGDLGYEVASSALRPNRRRRRALESPLEQAVDPPCERRDDLRRLYALDRAAIAVSRTRAVIWRLPRRSSVAFGHTRSRPFGPGRCFTELVVELPRPGEAWLARTGYRSQRWSGYRWIGAGSGRAARARYPRATGRDSASSGP